jgi:hypothetical protein
MGVKIANKPNQYAQHLVGKPVTAHTQVTKTTTYPGGVKEEQVLVDKTEDIGVAQMIAPHELHTLMVGGGMTIGLATKFEFARIDLQLTVPCTKPTLEDAYEWASDWVSAKIQAAVADAKG